MTQEQFDQFIFSLSLSRLECTMVLLGPTLGGGGRRHGSLPQGVAPEAPAVGPGRYVALVDNNPLATVGLEASQEAGLHVILGNFGPRSR